MERKIYEIELEYWQPHTLYVKDGKLKNICDKNDPYCYNNDYISIWNADSNRFETRKNLDKFIENTKITAPMFAVNNKDLNSCIKTHLNSLREYAEANNTSGNLFIIKKKIDIGYLIGFFLHEAEGDESCIRN